MTAHVIRFDTLQQAQALVSHQAPCLQCDRCGLASRLQHTSMADCTRALLVLSCLLALAAAPGCHTIRCHHPV